MTHWKLLTTAAVLTASSLAFAGGPEMPPPSHSAIFIGLGGAYNATQYENAIFSPFSTGTPAVITGFTNGLEDNRVVFGESAVGQLGYDYFSGTGGFLGIKGLFNYLNKNTQFTTPDFAGGVGGTGTSSNVVLELQSMVQAMLEGGVLIGKNAFYLEAGYAALFTKVDMRATEAAGIVSASQYNTLNGGVAGVGYRRYFWDSLYIDAVYSYALFADASTLNGTTAVPIILDDDSLGFGTISSHVQSVRVQDIVLTVNYAFNF